MLDIIEKESIGILQRNGVWDLDIKFRDDKTNVDPSSVTVTITYPCSSGSEAASATTTSTTGMWDMYWDIPSAATYGEYTVKIEADYDSHNYIFETFFYILPWNITHQVRSLSGVKQSNDIDDKDIAIIAWNAYIEAKEVVFKTVIDEYIYEDCNHYVDGSNKNFYARNKHLVSDHTICDEEAIEGYYLDNDYEWQDLTISITDADKGLLSIADENGDALDGSLCCRIHYTYRIKSTHFKEQMFKKAVAYLAAHETILRFNELDRATLADLNSNRPIILANPDRMKKKYKRTIKKISKIKVGGV